MDACAVIPCTLRQLEIFLAAAEDCHFVRTANRLGISQAAVSNQIAALEHQLGRQLFVRRRGRKPILSSYGTVLLGEARSHILEADRASGSRRRRTTPGRRVVRICSGAHLLNDCIKKRLPQFLKLHEDFDLECHYVDSSSQGASLVQNESMDMLVHTVANPADFPLHAEILRSVPFGLYASKKFASSRHASPAEVSSLPFILPPDGVPARNAVETALLSTGIVCRNVVARVQFIEVAKVMARQGAGVVPMFETMVTPDDAKHLIKLDVELPTVYRTLFRVNRRPDAAARSVATFLRETLAG